MLLRVQLYALLPVLEGVEVTDLALSLFRANNDLRDYAANYFRVQWALGVALNEDRLMPDA